jgi:hypothetical protein
MLRATAQPYLSADASLVASWSQIIGEPRRPRIGVMWRGAPTKGLENRTVPLDEFSSVFLESLDYISLQKELPDAESSAIKLHPNLFHYGDQQQDFADAAALIELVDIVISIDTSIAHLAGAMGKEVWILIPYAPDWRWLHARDDSPWYPSATLFRQTEFGDWSRVLQQIKLRVSERFRVPL